MDKFIFRSFSVGSIGYKFRTLVGVRASSSGGHTYGSKIPLTLKTNKQMDKFEEKSEAEDWYEKNLSVEDYLFFANLNYNIYNKKFDSGDTIKTLQENYDNKIKNLDQKYQKEKSEQKNDFENKLQSLNKELDVLNETKRNEVNKAAEQENQRGRIELQNAMNRKDEELSTKAEEIKKLTLEKDKAVEKEVHLKVGELKLEHSKNMKEVEEQLQNALKQNEINTAMIAELKEEKSTFQDEVKEHLQRKEKPTVIGQKGEEYVQDLLKNDSCIRVERISDQSHKGDFSVKFLNSSTCIMIDVKNYQEGKKLPLDQHKKFIEDLDKNPEYDCGILLSLNGGFTNNHVEFKIQESPNGKSYCCLGNLATRILPAIVLKCTLFSLLFGSEKSTSTNTSQSVLIETIQESIKSLTMIQTYATALNNQAEKTSTMARENMELIKKETKKIETKFEQIKMKWSNDEVDANGDYHGENPSPSKFQRNN